MGGLFQNFADPETERAFLRAERIERGQAIRALIVIAIATLLCYIFLNPMHFPREGVIAYTQAAGCFVAAGRLLLPDPHPNLSGEALARSAGLRRVGGAMTWLALVLAGLAPWTGFPPHVMVMIQMAILVIFASVGFAGTFRLFLAGRWSCSALFALWLLTRPGIPDISRVYTLTNFTTFFVFALYFNWDIERRARKVFAANRALEAERAKTEELLFNVLPQEVAARLRAGEAVADSFADLTAIFVDLVGFSSLVQAPVARPSGADAQHLLLRRRPLRRAARHGEGEDDRRRLSGGGRRHGLARARQQGGDPVRPRSDRRAGGDRGGDRPAAAGADRRA